jgi:hypothetical protein
MIKALGNPHFKKIWEKVITNRHSEVETLEEALKMELKHYGCYFFNPNQTMSTGVIVGWNDVGCSYISTEGINDKKQSIVVHIKDMFYQNSSIIGRPITLEDILLLLSKNGKARNEIGIILLENGNLCIKPQTGGGYDFEWKYSKSLHEQNPETWEKISESIK